MGIAHPPLSATEKTSQAFTPSGRSPHWRHSDECQCRMKESISVRQRIETNAGRRGGLRWAGRVTGVAVVALVGVGIAPGVASARPHNPSDTQIQPAQANIALDAFQAKQAEYEQAQAASQAADAAAQQAQADLDVARADVATFARTSYMSGSTSSRITAVLTSGSPAQMIERNALLD